MERKNWRVLSPTTRIALGISISFVSVLACNLPITISAREPQCSPGTLVIDDPLEPGRQVAMTEWEAYDPEKENTYSLKGEEGQELLDITFKLKWDEDTEQMTLITESPQIEFMEPDPVELYRGETTTFIPKVSLPSQVLVFGIIGIAYRPNGDLCINYQYLDQLEVFPVTPEPQGNDS